jgi:hypothetical protein
MTEPLLSREQLKPCPVCGKGLMHSGVPLVWKFTIQRIGIDGRKIQQERGLEMMLGGSAALASAFSPNIDFGVKLDDPKTLIVCEPCALLDRVVMETFE